MPNANPTPVPSYPPPASWEPSRNAIHRLIQYMDVLAIALNKFRQMTFRLPAAGTPEYGTRGAVLREFTGDYAAARRGIFPAAEFTPNRTAQRLVDDALAHAVWLGIRDAEPVVLIAGTWVSNAGWVLVPGTAEGYPSEMRQKFAEQGVMLFEYEECRKALLTKLASHGHLVPDWVRQRTQFAFAPLLEPGDLGVSVEELQRMVADAGGQTDTASAPTPLTPAPPAGVTIAELERRLRDCERAEGAVPAVGVATVSVQEHVTRAHEAALRSGHLAELRDAVTSLPGYAGLQTLCLKLMRCELTAAACVQIRCMLVDMDLSGADAGAKTVPEVVALLNAVVPSRNTGPHDRSAYRDRRGGHDYAPGDTDISPATPLGATGGRGSGEPSHLEPELAAAAPSPVVPADSPGKRRGPPLLSEGNSDKWKLYLLIHQDYAAHPRDRTASKLLERLKSRPDVLALCAGILTTDVVLAWEKHFKDSPRQYPTEMPRGNPPKD